jgi:G:T-mismatch repair DNA endonuclease (very short patch repair protein)
VLWDVGLAGADDDVECLLPADAHHGAVRGVRVHRSALPPDQLFGRRGLRVTTPIRTALDLAAIRPLDAAVVALDQFLAPGLVLPSELRNAAADLTGRNCRRVREAVALADGLAGSPQETRLRLLLHRSGLPTPVAQYSVRVDGRFVARVDFAWPEHRLAVEYEGVWHGERQQVARDRQRLNRLTAAGWRVVFVTAADLRDPARLLARIAAALAPRSA